MLKDFDTVGFVFCALGLFAGIGIGIMGGYYVINAMTPATPPAAPAAATT